MPNVTKIDEYKSQEIVGVLRELLVRAEHNQLRGLMFVFKTGPRRHRIGMAGEYLTDPFQSLACASRLAYKCNQLISVRDDEPHTDFSPL